MSENSNKEQIEAPLNSSAIDMTLSLQQTSITNMTNPNELKKSVKIQDLPSAVLNNHVTPAGISRERSFVRASNPQVRFIYFFKLNSNNYIKSKNHIL